MHRTMHTTLRPSPHSCVHCHNSAKPFLPLSSSSPLRQPGSSARALRTPPVRFSTDQRQEQTQSLVGEAKRALEELERKRPPPKYSPDAPQVDPLLPAFTRRREVFASRTAMVALSLACVLEAVLPNHPGLLVQASQLSLGTIEPATVYFLLLGLVAYNTERSTSLFWGATFEESNLNDVAKRPKGPPDAAIDLFNQPKQFLGISSWGFTKRNEIFHGRIAMLAFFIALVRGIRLGGLDGPGPLAQAADLLHLPLNYAAAGSCVGAFVAISVAIAFTTGNAGQRPVSEEEIY